MGWKASLIIVNKPAPISHEQLLHDLGFRSLNRIGEETVDKIIYPPKNEVYIGTYKDNIIICHAGLPIQFAYDSADAEGTLTNMFPDSEICSLVLHSTVNLWGYSVVKGGERLRARAGTHESGTLLDEGDPLKEEKDLLSKSKLGPDGQRTYRLPEHDETLTEDQVGENFVFSISERYFEGGIASSEEFLFHTKLTGYTTQ